MARRLYGALLAALAFAPITAIAEDLGTGYVPLTPEEYAKQPHAVRARSAVLLSKVDLSPYFPTPRTQGFQGSCTGWAVSYAARSYYLATVIGHKPLNDSEISSPAFVFNSSTSKPDTRGVFCGGATLVDALGVVVNRGSTSLAHNPYDQTTCLPAPTDADIALAQQWKVPGFQAIPVANLHVIDSYKEMLERGRPVIIGVRFNHSEWQNLHGPAVYALGPQSTGDFAKSGHAMVIVGYDDDKMAPTGERGAFRIINSWGT
ncbi:MAG: C1 family peptidase, partial [Asticcacaulis sp.]|nr:C1 family peptidase [Asticcacaulis sp.]